MREYLRMHAPGGQFFLTLVTHGRRAIFDHADRVAQLRNALAATMNRHPFTIHGAVILPDHLHLLIELPAGDADFSIRIALIKSAFSRAVSPDAGGETASPSRGRRRERAIWQRRFWEHTIRDERDFAAHMDYIHYNPVKHGLVACPHAWPFSSFHRAVRDGRYDRDWACSCARAATILVTVRIAERTAGE